MLAPALSAVLAGVTLVSLRGFFRGAVPTPLAFLAVLSASCAALADAQAPLVGWWRVESLVLYPTAVAVAIAYAGLAIAKRRTIAECQVVRPLGWLGVVAALSLVVVATALFIGRGLPQPSLDECARGELGDSIRPVNLQQGDYRVTGVYMDFGPATHNGNACELEVSLPSGKVERAKLSPPFGMSGSYHCGSGQAILCARAAFLIVDESPASPMEMKQLHGFRLSPSLSKLAQEPSFAAIASYFAPRRSDVLVASLGALLATVFFAGELGRRALASRASNRTASPQDAAHPYRASDREVELAAPARGLFFALPIPKMGAIAMILMTPLVVALLAR